MSDTALQSRVVALETERKELRLVVTGLLTIVRETHDAVCDEPQPCGCRIWHRISEAEEALNDEVRDPAT